MFLPLSLMFCRQLTLIPLSLLFCSRFCCDEILILITNPKHNYESVTRVSGPYVSFARIDWRRMKEGLIQFFTAAHVKSQILAFSSDWSIRHENLNSDWFVYIFRIFILLTKCRPSKISLSSVISLF